MAIFNSYVKLPEGNLLNSERDPVDDPIGTKRPATSNGTSRVTVAINGYKAREIRTPSYVCWLLNLPRTYVFLDTPEGIQNKNFSHFQGLCLHYVYTPPNPTWNCPTFSGEYHSGV